MKRRLSMAGPRTAAWPVVRDEAPATPSTINACPCASARASDLLGDRAEPWWHALKLGEGRGARPTPFAEPQGVPPTSSHNRSLDPALGEQVPERRPFREQM